MVVTKAYSGHLARRQQGFVLAASLWMLAIIFMLAGSFHSFVQRKVEAALQAKTAISAKLDQHSTSQTLTYMFATQRVTRAGLVPYRELAGSYRDAEGHVLSDSLGDEIRLDGTWYKGLGGVFFSLQDEAGLLPLNSSVVNRLSWLLKAYDVDQIKAGRLLDRLADYTDANDLVRLSGAETQDYAEVGLALPSNDYLRTAPELRRVMGWSEWLADESLNLPAWFAPKRSSLINLNTVPADLLALMLGISVAELEGLLHIREERAFNKVADFQARSGVRLAWSEDFYRFFPSNRIKLRMASAELGQLQVIGIQYTARGLLGPWLVDYNYTTDQMDGDRSSAERAPGPLFDAQEIKE